MAKYKIYKKIVIKKAADALREDSNVMYALYILRILRLNDIMPHHEPYNFSATARFKLNWFNPLALVLVTACIICSSICSIICSIIYNIFNVAKHIKYEITFHF